MATANETQTRRRFVATLPGLLAGVVGMTRWTDAAARHECGRTAAAHGGKVRSGARRAPTRHPEPRPGITGAKVLTKAQLTHNPDAAPAFDMVRRIPQIADGIRCHCGCADDPSFRSLLSCYEGDGMAQHCVICQGQGKLAFTLFEQGKSLAEIRAAIDKEFG